MPLSKREIQQRYYQRNKDKIASKRMEKREKYTAYQRGYRLKSYGITQDQYDSMMTEQKGRCKICFKEPKVFHLDHDHATMRVRGLLCGNCNRALGLAGDDPVVLRAMAAYLEASHGSR